MVTKSTYIEVESVEDFDRLVAEGARSMMGWHVQSVDLTERTNELASLDPTGSLFLGCTLEPGAERSLQRRGALVFPRIPEMPFNPYRGSLYTAEELYDGLDAGGYEATPDARIYAWAQAEREHSELAGTLAASLHDHAITDSLEESLAGQRVVGVMGGHAVRRGEPSYAEAALLGRSLARSGVLVATGGGPGAMEAANLGAYLAAHERATLDEAIDVLAAEPSFTPSATMWAKTAFAVRRKWPGSAPSIGIPTFHYGHEPPNVFASSIAKYFRNALREDTLLRWCRAGVAFLPGAAGTVQEIFQASTENYYSDITGLAPMVLIGRSHWTSRLPAWELLSALAADRPMAAAVHLVDSVEEAAEVLQS